MGDKKVTCEYDEHELRAFMKAVLNDLWAMETMLSHGVMEHGVRRIGAEQEMFIVDNAMRPAPLVEEMISGVGDPRLTTEIGKFNLEANLTPLDFETDCLSRMEKELHELLHKVKRAAARYDADVILAGILPTIQTSDLTEANLTPGARYSEINRVVSELHGGDRLIQIKGLDEIQLTLHDTFTEFCNTSFQIHLQLGADEFAEHYNWSQALAAPMLACSVNSPLLLGNRLWHETRIALFQHSTDTRSRVHRQRRQTPRVNFGDRWVDDSIIEILHEDAIRFRVLLAQTVEEDSMAELAAGRVPSLRAWRLHNGSIWRWNRACYGIINGKPGLRIEARYMPAGPSVADQIANMAFFVGLMCAVFQEYGDVRKLLPFDAAKDNFFNAARHGLESRIHWVDGKTYTSSRLILEHLLPLARRGLNEYGIYPDDADRLGIIEERVKSGITGAAWMLKSIDQMDKRAKPNVRMRCLTAAMKDNQASGLPVHKWPLAEIGAGSDWIDNYKSVEQFMITDLFTVRPDDIVHLAASLMDWRHVRHVPVEDDSGRLVGLLSHRDLVRLFARGKINESKELVVRDIMKKRLITVEPQTPTLEALRLMREKKIGCLPVVQDGKLLGVLTAHDFLTVSSKLFEDRLKSVL
jgi:CBS domain-containing protein/gamma-glutamyl:cysteine ligase YbdK (ATP-grasp superfamily)